MQKESLYKYLEYIESGHCHQAQSHDGHKGKDGSLHPSRPEHTSLPSCWSVFTTSASARWRVGGEGGGRLEAGETGHTNCVGLELLDTVAEIVGHLSSLFVQVKGNLWAKSSESPLHHHTKPLLWFKCQFWTSPCWAPSQLQRSQGRVCLCSQSACPPPKLKRSDANTIVMTTICKWVEGDFQSMVIKLRKPGQLQEVLCHQRFQQHQEWFAWDPMRMI